MIGPGSGMWRVGLGWDVHPFSGTPRPLVLGGVVFEGARGLSGHSDADVVAHAIADALLGALALGDIGRRFPDTDPRWAGASSLQLLAAVVSEIGTKGWAVVNVDAVVVCEEPKIAPRADEMRAALARVLRVGPEAVSVKGKRAEGLGALGRSEGIACQAVASVRFRGALRRLAAVAGRLGPWKGMRP